MKGYDDIAKALGKQNYQEAALFLEELLQTLEILPPQSANKGDLDILASSVNIQRLNNNPVWMDESEIKALYKEILEV